MALKNSLRRRSKPDLLGFLNQATSLIAQPETTPGEVYAVLDDLFQSWGVWGGVSLLDAWQETYMIHFLSHRDGFQEGVEELLGKKLLDRCVQIGEDGIYLRLKVGGKGLFFADAQNFLREWLPEITGNLTDTRLDGFAQNRAAACLLTFAGQEMGMMHIVGAELQQEDVVLLQTVANIVAAGLTNARPILERKSLEADYKSFFDELPVGVYRISPSGRFILANPYFLEMFGIEDFEQLKGKTLSVGDLKPTHDRNQVIQILVAEGAVNGLESEWEKPDGQKVYCKENIRASYDADGEVLYYQGVIEDITLKRQNEASIRKKLDDLMLLNRIAAVGASASSVDYLIENITSLLGETLSLSHFGFVLWDQTAGGLIVHPTYRGIAPEVRRSIIMPGEGVTGIVFETGLPMRLKDVNDFPEYISSNDGMRSELCVPIKTGKRILGVINAERIELDGFDEEDEILLATIADQVAVALERAIFNAEIENQSLQLRLLNEATLTTSRILEPEELINLIATQINDLFSPDSFLIALFDEEDMIEIAIAVENGQMDTKTTGLKIPVAQGGLTSLLMRTGEVLQIDDLENSPLLVGYRQMEVQMRGSWIGIPLVSGSKIIGALTVQYYERKVIDASDKQFLESLAAHAAIAITNGRNFNEIKDRYILNNRLAKLSEELNRPQTLQQVIEVIGQSALTLAGLEIGAVFQRVGDDSAKCIWSQGLSQVYLNGVVERFKDVPGANMISTPTPILIGNVEKLPEDAFIRLVAEAEGLRSIALWPLVYEGVTIAAVGCYSKSLHYWTEDHKEVMMTFARQAAVSLENARLFEAERNRRMEAEALYKTTSALTSTLDINKVLSNILVELYRAIDYSSASVKLLDGETIRIVAAQGLMIDAEKMVGFEFSSENLLFQRLSATRQPIILQDAQNSPEFEYLVGLDLSYVRGWLGVPLVVSDKMIGYLTLDSDKIGAFDQTDAKKAVAFANQAAIAIESARLFSQTQRRLQVLQSVHTIDKAISSNLDISLTLEVLTDQALSLLDADVVRVFSFDQNAKLFDLLSARDLTAERDLPDSELFNQAVVEEAIMRREIVNRTKMVSHQAGRQLSTPSYHVAPLISKGQIKGVVEVFKAKPFNPNEEWLDLLRTLSTQAAIAIENDNLLTDLKKSNEDLVAAYDKTLEGWAFALELRDRETVGHARRVTELTLKLARLMGYSGVELAHIRRGTLLHDIGKMGLPDSILLKEGPLDPDEEKLMKLHPKLAYDMLAPIPYLKPALDIPFCHHERWDGKGYPQGLKGEEIPLMARIFAVVDVWDALVYDRPYRGAWGNTQAIDYIRDQSGKHFDPQVVVNFLKVIEVEKKILPGV